MKIIDYFVSDQQDLLRAEIAKCDWSAARFLVKLLREGSFFQTLGGWGHLFLLMDSNELVSFATLTGQDAVQDEALMPWIGFVYTKEEYRGHRYAGKLLAHAESIAALMRYQKIYIGTDHIGLYEKYGYEYLENRVDCWGEDVRVLCKTLDRLHFIEQVFHEFCDENHITVRLSYEMPDGYETAFGTYDVTVNTLFFNCALLQQTPVFELLFYLFHELRHALQYLKPTLFDERIQKSCFYVVLFNGVCYKLVDQSWKECAFYGDYTDIYLSLPYEMDANVFAYQKVKEICGDSHELQELYCQFIPDRVVDYLQLQELFQKIDAAVENNNGI